MKIVAYGNGGREGERKEGREGERDSFFSWFVPFDDKIVYRLYLCFFPYHTFFYMKIDDYDEGKEIEEVNVATL